MWTPLLKNVNTEHKKERMASMDLKIGAAFLFRMFFGILYFLWLNNK
jgi:hypothetical protein